MSSIFRSASSALQLAIVLFVAYAHLQAINSIDRRQLNATLLDECASLGEDRLRLRFGHKLLRADFDARTLVFEANGEQRTVQADFVVGADGAHSRVRDQLMRKIPLDFSQSYIPEVYIELGIPAKAGGAFALDPHQCVGSPAAALTDAACTSGPAAITC